VRVVEAPPGSLVLDSLGFSEGGTLADARALRQTGASAVAVYIDIVTAERIGFILQVGMAVVPVTFGRPPSRWDADRDLSRMRALALPVGATVFLDVEGEEVMPDAVPVDQVKGGIATWAGKMRAAGEMPGIYVGEPQPLLGLELWELPVVRYWKGQGRCVDRRYRLADGTYALAEPTGSGWNMVQAYPSVVRGGIEVDLSITTADYLGRSIMWIAS
jgi:hypothetical protein